MASSLEKKIYITDRRYQDRPSSCRPSLRSLPPVSAPSPDDDGGDDDDCGGDDDLDDVSALSPPLKVSSSPPPGR